MPALPEIEVLRRDLEREVVTRRIKSAEIRPGTNAMKVVARYGRRREFEDLVKGAKVDGIDRVGASLVMHLDNGTDLIMNLGAAARLVKTGASAAVESHTHVVFTFTIGGQLRLIDPGRTSEIFVSARGDDADVLERGSVDPLEQQLAWQQFSMLLAERTEPIRDLLMNESFVCRLGPVYADEILWAAGLRYDRPSNKLSSQDVRRLYRALVEVVQDAVRARGTTTDADEFCDLAGNPGQYQLELKVYEREGESCRRCRNEIVREEHSGGEVYLCPQCQS